MSKSCVQIYYHLVWATKNRMPYLEPQIEEKLYRYIRALAYRKGVKLLAIGGTVDHIHILIKTNGTITSESFVTIIKFMTTKFINEKTDCCDYFMWQRGSIPIEFLLRGLVLRPQEAPLLYPQGRNCGLNN